MDAEKLLTYCLERLVDKPEALSVTKSTVDDRIVFSVTVDPSDRARVIGREGRTFKALRALINLTLEDNPHDIFIEAA